MRQVLFTIPIPFFDYDLPIFGFGIMLLAAFLVCTWLGTRRAKQEGINPDIVWDLAIWVFVGGIVGARVLSLIVDPVEGNLWDVLVQFVQIWKGGLIFYGSVVGGIIAYAIFHWRVARKQNLSVFRVADFAAPCIAIGIFFGRIGCFLNGCCWGDYADPAQVPAWQAVEFPTNSSPHAKLVTEGYQLAYGFAIKRTTVAIVDPGSDAYAQGLRAGDAIVQVGDTRLGDDSDADSGLLYNQLAHWPQSQPLRLTVRSPGIEEERNLVFALPRSLPLHPTQLYSSIDGFLAFLLLAAYYPFRRRPGEVIAVYMMLYAINRFLLERLRSDNPPAEFNGLTLSQNISVLAFIAGAALLVYLRRRPAQIVEPTPTPAAPKAA